VIHFDFDDRYQDELVVGSAISKREGILLSTAFHVLVLALILFGPEWTFLQPDPAELEARQQELLQLQREREAARQRFVFVQPRIDVEAPKPPELAELSDINRQARAPERAERPTNPLPFSRGDSAERAEAAPEERPRVPDTEVAQNPEPPRPEPPRPEPAKPEPQGQIARAQPPTPTGFRPELYPQIPPRLGAGLKNLDQYVQNQTFNNPQGGAADPGQAIQFDTRGIDFGPWVRRFIAQVKRNWFIPQAAMIDRGHVVLQFTVHRNGRITDLRIVKPSHNSAFNNAAYNAIATSNPLEPLPPDYPVPIIDPMTVTFYYNEQPPL
jgi:TonB family protein